MKSHDALNDQMLENNYSSVYKLTVHFFLRNKKGQLGHGPPSLGYGHEGRGQGPDTYLERSWKIHLLKNITLSSITEGLKA